MKGFLRRLWFHIPLTLSGFLTLGLSLYLLIHGLANRNAYEIVLGAALLLTLSGLIGVGVILKRKAGTLPPSWDIPNTLTASVPNKPFLVSGLPIPPLFFRAHFEGQGTLLVGSNKILHYSFDWIASGGRAEGSIPFSLCGEFQVKGYRTLRDIFGLVRIKLDPVLLRAFPILPFPPKKELSLRIDPSVGMEEKRTLKQADEERYFMREYTPGDRLRDINWKTSSRLAMLVTRIAPQSQDKTRIIPVALRSFGPLTLDLTALWTLDRLKAWVFQFLWMIRKEHPDYILRVTTPFLEEELSTDAEVETFCKDMASFAFSPQGKEEQFHSLLPLPEEVFVFSTSYDRALAQFVAQRSDRPTRLYITIPKRSLKPTNGLEPRLRFSSLGAGGTFPTSFKIFPLSSLPAPYSIRPLRGLVETQTAQVSL